MFLDLIVAKLNVQTPRQPLACGPPVTLLHPGLAQTSLEIALLGVILH